MPLLAVEVTPFSKHDVADLVANFARRKEPLIVGNLNLHGVYLFHTDLNMRNYTTAADLVLIDGAPIALAAKVSTKLRVGSTDWLDSFMPQADGLKVLAIGGSSRASSGAAQHFKTSFPNVRWAGIDGFEGLSEEEKLANEILTADVVLVGMGMPRQEKWILENQKLLTGKVVANVGGCLDYYAGAQRLAPRWMGRAGIEWAYRLLADPKRLSHRYLVEPIKLIALLTKLKLSRKREISTPENG